MAGLVVGIVMGILFSAAVVLAGSLEPVGGPTVAGSQMYTLDQIYDRLNTGVAGTVLFFTINGPEGGGIFHNYLT
jgi:hypothetical protein